MTGYDNGFSSLPQAINNMSFAGFDDVKDVGCLPLYHPWKAPETLIVFPDSDRQRATASVNRYWSELNNLPIWSNNF
jgi:hypothetical protein